MDIFSLRTRVNVTVLKLIGLLRFLDTWMTPLERH